MPATKRKGGKKTFLNVIRSGLTPKGPTRRKRKSTKRSRASMGPATGSPPKVDIDVKSPADLQKLTDMMKKYKSLIVFIYADWCGHCHSYRDQIWKNLPKAAAANNRGVGLAAINETMLDKTPLAGVPIDGYPTNLVINTEGKPGVVKPVLFKDEEGNVTPNIPNSRDMGTMTRLAQSTPEEIMNNSAGVSENTVSPAANAAAKGFPLTENNYNSTLNTAAGSSNSTVPFGNSATGSRNSANATRNSNATTIPVNSRVTAPASASLPNLDEPMNTSTVTASPSLSAAAAPPSPEEDLLLSQSKAPANAASLRNSVQNLSAANKTLKGGGQVGGAALRFLKEYRGSFGGKKSARARRGRRGGRR